MYTNDIIIMIEYTTAQVANIIPIGADLLGEVGYGPA